MIKFIIKYGPLYFNSYLGDNFGSDVWGATMYAHQDIAKNIIDQKKLPPECKVWQVNFVELEVK